MTEAHDIDALWNRVRLIEAGIGFLGVLDARAFEDAGAFLAPKVAISGFPFADLPDGMWERTHLTEALSKALAAVTSHHQCTNPIVGLRDGDADVAWMTAARYRRPTLRGGDGFATFGTLRIRFTAEGQRWPIAGLHQDVRASEGNPGILSAGATVLEPPPATPFAEGSPPPSDAAARLRWLEDRAEIHDLMMRFGRALDAKDWPLYRSCLADRLVLDFSQTTGQPPKEIDADLFTEFAGLRQRGHASFHQYSNFQCAIDGDRARIRLYLMARHMGGRTRGDALNVFVGWYDNVLERTTTGWRLVRLGHPLRWVEGNAEIKDAPDPEADRLAAQLFAE